MVLYSLSATRHYLDIMSKSIVQEQEYHLEVNELLIQRIYAAVSDQLDHKRWEFQHTDIDPNRLWDIANQVEALNWVSRKLSGLLGRHKGVNDSSVNSLITLLVRVLDRTDKRLLKFKTNSKNFYEFYRLKSRATIIEWSLFQIHFVSSDLLRTKEANQKCRDI